MCIYPNIFICIYAYTYVYVMVYMYAYVLSLCFNICTHTHAYIVCVCVYLYKYQYLHVLTLILSYLLCLSLYSKMFQCLTLSTYIHIYDYTSNCIFVCLFTFWPLMMLGKRTWRMLCKFLFNPLFKINKARLPTKKNLFRNETQLTLNLYT